MKGSKVAVKRKQSAVLLLAILFLLSFDVNVLTAFAEESANESSEFAQPVVQKCTSLTASTGVQKELKCQVKIDVPSGSFGNEPLAEISSSTDFTQGFRLKNPNGSSVFEIMLKPGSYYLRYQQANQASPQTLEWSKPFPFFVQVPDPKPLQGTPKVGSRNRVRLAWKPIPGAKTYAVKLEKDGEAPKEFFTSSAALVLNPLPPGKYRWTVSVSSQKTSQSSGRSIASVTSASDSPSWSKPLSFMVESSRSSKVSPLRLVSPTGSIMHTPEPMTFLWKDDRQAVRYHLRLYRLPGDEDDDDKAPELLGEQLSLSTHFSSNMAADLPPGDYRWQLQAVDETSGRSLGKSDSEFSVHDVFDKRRSRGFVEAGFISSTLSYTGATADLDASFDTTYMGPAISGRYYIKNQIFVQGGYAVQGYTYQTTNLSRKVLSVSGGYENFLDENHQWAYSASLGIKSISSPEVLATSDTETTTGSRTSISLLPSLEVSRDAGRLAQIYAHGSVGRQISSSGGSSSASSTSTVQSSFSSEIGVGIRGYWFWPFGVRIEASHMSEKYTLTSSSGGDVTVSLGGTQYFGGLMFSF